MDPSPPLNKSDIFLQPPPPPPPFKQTIKKIWIKSSLFECYTKIDLESVFIKSAQKKTKEREKKEEVEEEEEAGKEEEEEEERKKMCAHMSHGSLEFRMQLSKVTILYLFLEVFFYSCYSLTGMQDSLPWLKTMSTSIRAEKTLLKTYISRMCILVRYSVIIAIPQHTYVLFILIWSP